MRNVTWPLAAIVIALIGVIGAVALAKDDVSAVSGAIITVLIALGLAELREIKSQTNGNNQTLMVQNKALLDELAEYRRSNARITDRALESAPLGPPPGDSVTNSTTTTTVTMTPPSSQSSSSSGP
jgi:hypothetical protein